jgi:hypothetical protein
MNPVHEPARIRFARALPCPTQSVLSKAKSSFTNSAGGFKNYLSEDVDWKAFPVIEETARIDESRTPIPLK